MSEQPPKILSPELPKIVDSTSLEMPLWLAAVQQRYEERQKREALGTEQEYQKEQWKKWEEKYGERRKHSEAVDDGENSQLRGGDKAWHTQSEIGSSNHLVKMMLGATDFIKPKLAGRPLTDIGAGIRGFNNALVMTGHESQRDKGTIIKGTETDLGMSKVVLVDPFGQSNFEEGRDSKQYINREGMTDEERAEMKKRFDFQKRGGQSYLLEQAPGSMNVMCGSVDESIIPVQEAQRIAQEIFRVVPEDGLFVSFISENIEEEARKLFPYSLEAQHDLYIFSKSPLPTREELEKLVQKQRVEKN